MWESRDSEARSAAPACEAFIARHSDFVDGRMTALEEMQWRMHVASCASCSRYDRVVRQGGELLRELSAVSVSADFGERFRERLLRLPEEERERDVGSGGSAATALLVAGVIAAIAWSPLLRTGADRPPPPSEIATTISTSAARRAEAPGVATPLYEVGGPLGGYAVLPDRVRPLFTDAAGSYLDGGDTYSPLVITPPVYRLTSTTRPASGPLGAR